VDASRDLIIRLGGFIVLLSDPEPERR